VCQLQAVIRKLNQCLLEITKVVIKRPFSE
jgi:hypothetical protein